MNYTDVKHRYSMVHTAKCNIFDEHYAVSKIIHRFYRAKNTSSVQNFYSYNVTRARVLSSTIVHEGKEIIKVQRETE